MFEKGEYVIYANEGVCQVSEVGHPDLPSADKQRLYYTLQPIYREGTNYVPVDTKVFMRPVISKEEALELIRQMPQIEANTIQNTSMRELTDHYAGIMESKDCSDLAILMKTVYEKRQRLSDNGKKLGQIDERFMKRAEELLYGELAVVLELNRDDVPGFIEETIAAIQ